MKIVLLKYYLIVVLISFYQLVSAQSFMNIDVAQNFSTFKFSYNILDDDNLLSDEQKYNQISSIAYGIGYTNLRSSGLFFTGGLGFRKAGASLAYKKNSFVWQLQYIDAKVGVGYLYNRWIIKPYVYLMPYYGYLLSANQSSGLNYYDIKTDNVLKSHDFGLLLNGGIKVPVSYYADIFAEYNYNLGLRNIETAPQQFLYNRGFAIKLGLSINITNFKKAQEQINTAPIDQLNANIPAQNPSSEIESTINNDNTTQIPSTPIDTETNDKNNGTKTIQTNANSLTGDDVAIDISENSTLNSQSNNNTSISNTDNLSNNTNLNNNATSSIPIENEKTNSTPKIESKEPANKASEPNSNTNVPINKINNLSETQNNKKTPPNVNKVDFKIQLTAVKNALGAQHPIYKNFKGNIQSEKGKDGWLRYYIGSFESYEEALKELRKAKEKGLIDGGFIVAFKKNKKISVAEAKELLK